MAIVAMILVGLVALLHVYILLLEVLWWDTPRGHKAFGLKPDFARQTRVLAINQGAYNGFLAAGLIWGLVHPDPVFAWQIQLFFLACVAVAGSAARSRAPVGGSRSRSRLIPRRTRTR